MSTVSANPSSDGASWTGPPVSQSLSRRERFDQEVIPHLDLMARTAATLSGQPADAEDLVQETLLRAFQGLDRFDGTYPRAWLLTILRNLAINRARRRRIALCPDTDALGAPPPARVTDAWPEPSVMARSLDPEVASAFASLGVKFREVIGLVDVEGLTYAEAATALGIPKGTVMSRLHRGRQAIRDQLRRPSADAAPLRALREDTPRPTRGPAPRGRRPPERRPAKRPAHCTRA